ncbi:hypothetical protein [Streptomyces stackebrandtii]|uniref:hypothetical protein n=1 Tax=Streptomyces stackebrandtii TaxID=3051177 RepID=UPI0028DB55B0|nr:hypothetical protein [Streptomyces sp. DSM 40976]
MHNMDRTQLEFGQGAEGASAGEAYGAYAPEFADAAEYDTGEAEWSAQEAGGPLDEVQEMELAGELLEVTDEAEMDQFLGKLVRIAAPLLRGGPGKALTGILRGAARQFLPALGSIAGNLLVPGLGGVVGGQLASKAGSLLGLEVEGLSREDQEFEAARQFVRFAADAARNAAGPEGEAEAEYEGEYGAAYEGEGEGDLEGDFEGDFEGDLGSAYEADLAGEFGDVSGAEFAFAGEGEGEGEEGEGDLESFAADEYEGVGEGEDAYTSEGEDAYEGEGELDPAAARAAVLSAAQRYAPGLVPIVSGAVSGTTGPGAYGGRRASGRWVRRGRTIVLIGM